LSVKLENVIVGENQMLTVFLNWTTRKSQIRGCV
jgi:hypothetical protein